jgi:hypothetical protein
MATFGRRALLLMTAVAVAACALGARVSPAPLRVLFIGNSYTYYNNLPEVVGQLSAAAGQPVDVRMVAPGGWRLADHWDKGDARPVVIGGRWDFVVLQEQSTLGLNYYVDGRVRISGDEVFRPSADRWAAEIRRAGAKPVFYLTWSRRAVPEDQPALTHAYMSAARAGSATVAPVGLAWDAVRREHPGIVLYAADGSHPSPAGTYLAACTMVAALLDHNPVGLPRTVRGHPVNLDAEAVVPDKTAVLIDLPEADARILQAAAWTAWQELRRRGGYVETHPVPLPVPSPLPAPEAVEPTAFEGTWTGTVTIHPSGPSTISLRLRHGASGWEGHLDIDYRSKELALESVDLRTVSIETGQIRFTVAASPALANLPVEFRGVAVGPGEIRGVADARSTQPTSPTRLLGSWQLRRMK